MRSLVVLVSLVLFFPACSNNQVADKVSESKTEKRTESEKSRLENDSETVASELFESLKIAYEKKRTQWQEQRAKPMSPMEQQAHFKAHPASGYGEELVEFAVKYPDSLAAKQAWMAAAKFAQGENKNRAADQVLQSVIADLDSPSTMEKSSSESSVRKERERISNGQSWKRLCVLWRGMWMFFSKRTSAGSNEASTRSRSGARQ